MPIMKPRDRAEEAAVRAESFLLLAVPMEMMAPHEAQAQRNHSQSLDRLAERGGLSACEAVAILEDRRFHRMDTVAAYRRLNELFNDAAAAA